MVADVRLCNEQVLSNEMTDIDKFFSNKVNKMQKARHFIMDATKRKRLKSKTKYDAKSKSVTFALGDEVIVYTPRQRQGHPRKLLYQWLGPVKIIGKLSNECYSVELEPGTSIRVHACTTCTQISQEK